MKQASHKDWAEVAATLIQRSNWTPAISVELTLNPNRQTNRRLTKKGQLVWDATLQDQLRNIVGKQLSEFVERPKAKRHWRWSVSVGQSPSGAIGFHIVGFTFNEEGIPGEAEKEKLAHILVRARDFKWLDQRGKEHCAEAYGKDGKSGKLNYLLNHHTILMMDELMCPRKSRPCKKGRCVCKK